MRLTVERDEFVDTVTWAARTLAVKAQVQVLAGVLLEADGDLTVSSFDYEVATKGTMPAAVTTPGRVLVHGRLLADVIRNLPAAPIDLELDGSRLSLVCGAARFQFPTLNVEDFPALPELPPAAGRVEASTLADAVAHVAYAAAPNSPVVALMGVNVEAVGTELVFAATDRYRIAARWLDWRPDGQDAKVLPHARHLSDAAKALAGQGELLVCIAPEMLGLASSRRQVTMRAITEPFPEFRKLIVPCQLTAVFDVPELVAALKLISPTVVDKEAVHFAFGPGRAVVTGGSAATGSCDVACGYDGLEFTVSYNPRYLLDALGALEGDTAVLGFLSDSDHGINARRPTRLSGKDDRHEQILMPVIKQ